MKKMRYLLAAVVLLAACGSNEPANTTAAESGSDTTEAAADSSPDTTAATGSDTATITMVGFEFDGPQTVQVGQTIELVNEDSASHTWTAEDGPFDVSVAGGATETYTFEEAGTFSYFCKIHPNMTGSITVEG